MLELLLLIIRLLLIKKKTPVKANSYYVTNLKTIYGVFYEDFYFDGEEWDKDVWDRRNLPLPDDKLTQHNMNIQLTLKGFGIHILNSL